ncbi:MAG TPA: glycoside hydrolase family 31 protein, partial [Clostridia bacterium]|nr:glycoside hydrolase family 31 protein [Clostridia bacterium]
VCRPLMIAYPDDPNCNENQWPYQYLLGSDILSAPVYDDEGWMDIYLPKDNDWVDYWSKQVFAGGQVLRIDTTDISKIPLFIRKGAIIPMQEDCSWMEHGKTLDPLCLDIYPDKSGGFVLYEDDGTTLEYQQGKFTLTELKYTFENNKLTLHIGPSIGEYVGKPSERKVIAVVHSVAGNVGKPIQSQGAKEQRCFFDETTFYSEFTMDTGKPAIVEYELKF